MPRQMKDSGVEWIGEMPSQWNVSKVGYFFVFSSGDSITSEQIGDIGEFVVYGANGIRGYYDSFNLSGKHILIGRVGALCGNVHIVDGNIWVTEHALIANKKLSLCEEYFGYAFESMNLVQYSKASAQPVISSDTISKLKLPVPPMDVQFAIAKYLDEQCEHINSVLEQTRSSIEEYKKLKKAMITQAVTKGVRGDRTMKDSNVEWIGSIPENWKVYRIANLYDERSESGLEELPILTVSINTGVSDHEISDEDKDRVFVRSEDRTKYKRVYPGDLAYNMMRAWQGAFGAVRVDGMVSPAYVVAKPKRNVKLDSRYMEALLRTSEATEEMHRYSRGIVNFRLRLYWPEFKNIRICLPPIAEQIEIADYIDEKSAAIDALIAKKEAFVSELENYKKSMIYEYVTGKKEVPQL